jgi:hypothetical protein
MAAGITDDIWDIRELAAVVEIWNGEDVKSSRSK